MYMSVMRMHTNQDRSEGRSRSWGVVDVCGAGDACVVPACEEDGVLPNYRESYCGSMCVAL